MTTVGEMRERLASTAVNNRERELIRQVKRIADSLEFIGETLSIMYGRKMMECDPLATLAEMALVPDGTKAEGREKKADG
jgi:hypothetical protein